MNFIYDRRWLSNHIGGLCFFMPNILEKKSKDIEHVPYTIIYNGSIVRVYDPVHRILEKNLYKPIKQILNSDHSLYILFMDGDIAEVEYNTGELNLISLMYIDEMGHNVFFRTDRNVLYIHYNDLKFGIHIFTENKHLNKQKISENYDSSFYRTIKAGLHSFHKISPNLNNIKDVILKDDIIYFLYSPDLINMYVLAVSLCNFKILKEIQVDNTAFKFFKFGNTHILVISEKTLYFIFAGCLLMAYDMPFEKLFSENNTHLNLVCKDNNHRLFNTAELTFNDNVYIFNGDDTIFSIELDLVGHHIQSINASVHSSFFQYKEIRYAVRNSNFVFLTLKNRTGILLKLKTKCELKRKKNILPSELDDTTDLYNTHVQLNEHDSITETSVSTICGYDLIKTHYSFGKIRYVFEQNKGDMKEYFIAANSLIRYFESICLKYKRYSKIGNYKRICKSGDLFVATNDTSSYFFKWNNNKITKYVCDAKNTTVKEITNNLVQQHEEHTNNICDQTENTLITTQETLALLHINGKAIQVTKNCIIIENYGQIPINGDQAQHNEKCIFIKTANTLNIYSLLNLSDCVLHPLISFENVASYHVNNTYMLLCCLENLSSHIKLFVDDDLIFSSRIDDFYARICDDELLKINKIANEQSSGCSTDTKTPFIINECIVYCINDVVTLILKNKIIIAIYEGVMVENTISFFKKKHQIISFYESSLSYTDSLVFIKRHLILATCNNKLQKITNKFDHIIGDNEQVFGITKKNIIEIKLESNITNYFFKIHDTKNLDKIIRDDKKGIYVFTFKPKTYNSDQIQNNTDEKMDNSDCCSEKQELVLSTLNFNNLSIFRLPTNELVTDLKLMNLCDASGDFNDYVVVTLSQRTSDEILRGRILVFEVIDVICEENKTKKALKLLGSERTKGPISCCAAVRGKIAISLATKLMVYEFDKNNGIVAIAFYDLYMFVVSLATVKNYIIVADIMMGLHFLYFQSEPVKLHLLGKSEKIRDLTSLDFINAGKYLYMVCVDVIGKIRIYSYSPNNIFSNNGDRLIKRQEFNTFTDLKSIQTKLYCGHTTFFSSNGFFIKIFGTQINYESICSLLKEYVRSKNFFGINLKYKYREICFDEYINTELLRDFLNETTNFQKSICKKINHDYEEVMHQMQKIITH